MTIRLSTAAPAALALVFAAGAASAQECSSLAKDRAAGATVTNVVFEQPAARSKDIIDTAVGAGNFKTLAAALKAAGLVNALKGEGPFTVFAPTDEAFAKLPAGTLDNLLKPENKGLLTSILTFHVVPGHVDAAEVVRNTTAATLNGQRIDIMVGKGVMVENANVVTTDIKCSNGVIHVIDRVIMPSTDNIIDTAVSAGSFESLAAALKAAGLISTLSDDGPFTVFAPTDTAFAKLPAGTVDSLFLPENRAKLTGILKLHVVSGRVYAKDALAAETADSLQGSRLRFTVDGANIKVNGARIVGADVETSNGVIHVIDTVLLPQ